MRLVNLAFATMLGYEPHQLVGRHFSEITHPRDRALSAAASAEILRGTGVVQIDKRYIDARGKTVWARTKIALIRGTDATAGVFVVQSEDIRARRAAEQRLTRSEAFLHRIFDSSAVAKVLLDKRGRAVQVNRAMLALTGRDTFDELSGDRLLSHVLAPHDDAIRDFCRTSRHDAQLEARLRRADGSIATVLCLMGPATSPAGAPLMIVQMVDISSRKTAEDLLTFRSSHDELTGLANRRLFADELKAALGGRRSRHSRQSKTAVLMIDLDRFKEVNDGLGHAAGDTILIEVARRLEAVTRRTDTVGRIGGDEFWVVARDVEGDIGAVTLATAILRALARPFRIDDAAVHVGASIGFCLAPDDGTAVQLLMSRADAAQYRAKAAGAGWAGYAHASDEQRLELLELARDLRLTIDSEELDIVYQPLFAAGGGIVGFEALSRWNHPERGAIPPDVFLPLAEHAHLMAALTRTVLRRSAHQCAQWRAAGHDVSIAVNLAPSLLRDDSLIDLVATELGAAGLGADHLTLEITEGKLADGSDPAISHVLGELHRLGVRLSIDDFGTGYSSLAYLKELPVDELKIDRSFVSHIDTDSRDAAIVSCVVDLAKVLGLDVVAEGVESDAVADNLRRSGCDILQGFGLGRPRSAGHAVALLDAQATLPVRARRVPPSPAGRRLTIVLAENNTRTRRDLSRTLGAGGHHVETAGDGPDVIANVRDSHVDLVILSQVMPGELSGVRTSAALRASGYTRPIIVLFTVARSNGGRSRRFPIDVWPVEKKDHATLLHLVTGCAGRDLQPAVEAPFPASGTPSAHQVGAGTRP